MGSRIFQLREQILRLAKEYYEEQFPNRPFVAGKSPVPVSGKVLNGKDLRSLVDAALDCWLTTGRFAQEFERRFAKFLSIGVYPSLTTEMVEYMIQVIREAPLACAAVRIL